MKKRVLHFGLGENFGNILTQIAREKAWDDCSPSDAILMLMENLHGITLDQAKDVVYGKKKFVTNDKSTVVLRKDNFTPPDLDKIKKETIDRVQFIFTIRSDTGTPGSLDNFFKKISEGEYDSLCSFAKDIIRMTKYNPPEAKRMADSFETIVMDLRHQLADRIMGRCGPGPRAKDDIKNIKECGEQLGALEQVKAEAISRIATSDLDEDMKRRLIRVADGKTSDAILEVDPKFKYDTGWLCPEGVYYGCKPGQHIALSEMLVEQFYPEAVSEGALQKREDKKFFGIVNYEDILEEEGWIKCTDKQWVAVEKPTQIQIAKIKEWAKIWSKDGTISWNGSKTMLEEIG